MGVLRASGSALYYWPVSVCPHPRHSPTTASARARVGAVSLQPLLSESPADLSTPAIGGGSRFAARREVARDQQKARHRFLRGDGLPQKNLGLNRSLEEIANLMNRSPEAIHKVAIRLGISLRNGRRRSTPSERLRVMRMFHVRWHRGEGEIERDADG
jgi:hypothetical protein